MNNHLMKTGEILILWLMIMLRCNASNGYELTKDPFLQPDNIGKTSSAKGTSGRQVESGVLPELQAIMFLGSNSLVNLGGETLMNGDQINGYRVIKIKEKDVIFEKDGTRMTRSLGKPIIEGLK